MDASFVLAENVVNIKYEDLPKQVVAVTKKSILDTLGVMLAASTLGEGCREMVELAKEGSGRQESTIIAFGGRAPAPMAAFANGSMVHPLDYDDTADGAAVHPTASTLPAALAIAERVGGVNGKDFITAIALGGDMAIRLALALPKGVLAYGWHPSSVMTYFSATAVSGKLLGLSREQMVDAFGIVLNRAAGSREMASSPDSVMRGIKDAFFAEAGVMSALMAQKGITGVKTCLEGPYGLFGLYFKGEYDPARLTTELGKRFELANVSFKPWPSCRSTHTYIDATLRLVREHNIKPEDVKGVKLLVGELGRGLCLPEEQRRAPSLAIGARFSLPFCVSVAIVRRKVTLADFTPQGLKDEKVLQLAQKVTWEFNPKAVAVGPIEPAVVEITCGGEKVYSKQIDIAYGNPQNPMTMDDFIAKFRDCAAYSVKPLDKATVDKVIQLVMGLEEVPDVTQVVHLLS